jgi:N-sulfoglucosamine sulfohydrolase
MGRSRRTFIKSAATAFGSSVLGQNLLSGEANAADSSAPYVAKATKRPNILYINSHDTGRFTSPYGIASPTPNLQKLASEGVCFTKVHCAAPTCSASRACLLTGAYAHCNGMLGLVNRGFSLSNYEQHILHTLRHEAGYYSALVGLQHVAKHSSMIGYDHYEDIPGNHVEQVAPAAVRFLKSRPKEPFWLEVGFFETHRPYRMSSGMEATRYRQPPAPMPDVPETRQDMADFYASASKLDWGVGEVLAALVAEGLAENTLVISATDHGIAFPDMKTCLYDAGMGVHLLMRGPGGFSGGKVCDAMISHVDLFPTLCDVLEIKKPGWLNGTSFLPAIRGEKQEVNTEIFAELNYHAAYEPKRAVRTQRWKYIRHYSSYPYPVLPNCDDGPSKSYWVKNGWGKQLVAKEELFDLMFDPNERNNLIASEPHREILKMMQQKLQDWMERTSDPLLKGPVPAPHGARVNPPDQLSPKDPAMVIS